MHIANRENSLKILNRQCRKADNIVARFRHVDQCCILFSYKLEEWNF